VAKFVAKDYDITIGGESFSTSLAAVTLSLSAEEQETTAFGSDFRSRISGLRDASISLEFHQDFGASSVDATLFPLLGNEVEVIVKPTSDAVSATNPGFTGTFLVTEYSPLDSSIGDLATLSVEWPLASGSIVRDEGGA
jgi:hypothetical protein